MSTSIVKSTRSCSWHQSFQRQPTSQQIWLPAIVIGGPRTARLSCRPRSLQEWPSGRMTTSSTILKEAVPSSSSLPSTAASKIDQPLKYSTNPQKIRPRYQQSRATWTSSSLTIFSESATVDHPTTPPVTITSVGAMYHPYCNKTGPGHLNTSNENALWFAVTPIMVSIGADGTQPMFYNQANRTVRYLPVPYTSSNKMNSTWTIFGVEEFIHVFIGDMRVLATGKRTPQPGR